MAVEEIGYGWTVGATLMGVMINTYLFGVTSYQFLCYYTTDFQDRFWIKAFVFALLVVDVFHSCTMIYIPWFMCVKNFNNPSMLAYPLWAYLLTPTLDSFSAVITQVFLAIRVYKLVRNRYLFGVIGALIGISFIFGVAVGIRVWWLPSLAQASDIRYLCVPWLVFQATADIVISATLSYSFWHTRTGNRQTDWAMNTLFRRALQTGMPAAIVALLVLFTYVQFGTRTSNLFAVFSFPHGRVYTLTLLDTLLVRTELRQGMKNTNISLIVNEDRPEGRRSENVEVQLVRLNSASAFKNTHLFMQDGDDKEHT